MKLSICLTAGSFLLSAMIVPVAASAETAAGADMRLLTSVPAVGYDDKTENVDIKGVRQVEEDKKICKEDQSTGSRLRKKRICKTEAEWDEINRTSRQDADSLNKNSEYQRAPLPPRGGG